MASLGPHAIAGFGELSQSSENGRRPLPQPDARGEGWAEEHTDEGITTARRAADLGIIPVMPTGACGAGHEAAARSSASPLFAGSAIISDVESVELLNERTPTNNLV